MSDHHIDIYDVPRETKDKLYQYCEMLLKWQKKINLISLPTDLKDKESYIFNRHIIDSLQIQKFITPDKVIIDIGSGAGLPGLILATILSNKIYLIESDQRKCEFLKEASRSLQVTNVEIICERIETCYFNHEKKDITITSRACASIAKLFSLTQHLHQNTNFILLKGENIDQELTEAKKSWYFEYNLQPSKTNLGGHIFLADKVLPK